jgi:tetratricopeptide (TPR) repeat protein
VYLEQGNIDDALRELLELTKMAENDEQLRRTIAGLFERKDQNSAAVAWYLDAIRIDPYSHQSHEDLARLYVKTNRLDAAAREYQVLCTLAPTEAKHFSRLAFLLHQQGQKEKALQAARSAVEIDPESPAKSLLPDN